MEENKKQETERNIDISMKSNNYKKIDIDIEGPPSQFPIFIHPIKKKIKAIFFNRNRKGKKIRRRNAKSS